MTNIKEELLKVETLIKNGIDHFFASKLKNLSNEDNFNQIDRSKNLLTEELGKEIIKPIGYDLMVQIYKRPEKIGKVFITDAARASDKYNNRVVKVLAFGPLAYSEKHKFPNGPWCEVGQWVLVRPYEMSQFSITERDPNGDEYDLAFIHDDKIRGIVLNPENIDTNGVVGR